MGKRGPSAAAARRSPVIGLTGPMCAGKNVAAQILEARGYAVLDADLAAHRALADRQTEVFAAFEETARKRGLHIRNGDGSLNRRALGALLFADPALLARHEAILYPRINEIIGRFIDENADRPVVINAPLLHKSEVLARCSFVIFVDAPLIVRLCRAMRRDKLPASQIFARFSAQKNLFAQYLSKNVDIQRVHNRGSRRALERKLARLLSRRGY